MRRWLLGVPFVLAVTGCEPTWLVPEQDASPDAEAARATALEWLESTGALDGVDELALVGVEVDRLGMAHVRFQQRLGGVPVQGAQVVVHLDAWGGVRGATDRVRRRLDLDVDPVVDADLAQELARERAKGRGRVSGVDLEIVRADGTDRLAWLVQIEDLECDHPSRPLLAIDAQSGQELFRYDNLQTVRNRRTYTSGQTVTLPGTLRRSEGSAPVGDQALDAAHENAGHTWDYYWNEQGRDSWDGNGATLTSSVHYSVGYENAFWNGSQMVYGDGGYWFYPLSLGTDIVGHEITHAVTERTAGLLYSGESGGLNEGTSDIFGAVIESYAQGWAVDADTWRVGEDVARAPMGDALRYMDDPSRDGASVGSYDDYVPGMDVHYSSGIANRAFYLMSQDLGVRDAADVWYRALAYHMTPSTTFAEAADATRVAAEELYGERSAQVDAVVAAWAAVGVLTLDWNVLATEPGLDGATGAMLRFTYDLPPGARAMAFSLAGANGDADLYVRRGSAPTTSTYDCGSYSPTSVERCEIAPASAGTYHVLVHAWAAFTDVDLVVETDVASAPEVCDDGADDDGDGATDCADTDCSSDPACAAGDEVCGDGLDNDGNGITDCLDAACSREPSCLFAGQAGSVRRWTVTTPPGATGLDVSIAGGTGDADLYVRFDAPPRANRWDCRPYEVDANETCLFEPPRDGVYHLAVHGYSAYRGVSLTVTPTF